MREILKKVRNGEISVDEAERLLCSGVLSVGSCAHADIFRQARTGIPEIVLADGKKEKYLIEIINRTLDVKDRVIVSRVDSDTVKRMREKDLNARYFEEANVCIFTKGEYTPPPKKGGTVGIITAGTSDIPVAEEAMVVAEELGCTVYTSYDVGIAGVHRLAPVLDDMRDKVDVYIVAAGREGALPTLVAGLVDTLVIGLPVSVGYGAGEKGAAALQAMLQSCSPLVVVNIDAGTVAGAVAAQVANRIARGKQKNRGG